MNNSSLLTADRTTHLKIVVVSLVCATLVAGAGVASRINETDDGRPEATASIVKSAIPMTAASRPQPVIR